MTKNIKDWLYILLFYFCRVFPIQKKVIATTMRGRKYGDNPRFILEELKKELPELDFVWLVAGDVDIETPA